MLEPDSDAITLRIYCGPGGQWAGRLFLGTEEIGVLGAFDSSQEVEQAANEIGLHPEHVEVDAS
jgi:hypothetical protein